MLRQQALDARVCLGPGIGVRFARRGVVFRIAVRIGRQLDREGSVLRSVEVFIQMFEQLRSATLQL